MKNSDVLLIEPDAELASTYRRALEDDGHNVRVAHSAQSALHLADEHQPDVVVLELQLTDHSGIEFLYEFRTYQDWQTVPVVVHSIVPERVFQTSRLVFRQELNIHTYCYKPTTSLRQLRATVHALKV